MADSLSLGGALPVAAMAVWLVSFQLSFVAIERSAAVIQRDRRIGQCSGDAKVRQRWPERAHQVRLLDGTIADCEADDQDIFPGEDRQARGDVFQEPLRNNYALGATGDQ